MLKTLFKVNLYQIFCFSCFLLDEENFFDIMDQKLYISNNSSRGRFMLVLEFESRPFVVFMTLLLNILDNKYQILFK